MQTLRKSPKQFPQPLDRAAIGLMLILVILMGILLLSGDRSAPRVRDFTWQDKQVGADDNAFLLNFNRPMDHASVEQNLRIDPPLPGKVSWAGRRMAYTLNSPAPYGTSFQVSLQNARDRFTKEGSKQGILKPFVGSFRSRDRAFAYIGTEGDTAGRLVFYNLSRQEKKILTPPNLTVMDFRPYPQGDKILFSAIERTKEPQPLTEQKLYTVTTGVLVDAPQSLDDSAEWNLTQDSPSANPLGQVEQILDNRDYQVLKFDLSANGQVIVAQRINRKDPNDSGPWIIHPNQEPQPLNSKQAGGDFLITPDSDSLAIAQGQGLALLPLKPQADPLDFLPKFGTVLSFARDGSAAAMVKFNTDYTRSLFIVTNQGTQQEVFKTTGSILSAQFDPTNQILYCLLTNLVPGKTYQEQPYLASLDLKAALKGALPDQTLRPLILLPVQQEIQMSLAPDGLGILFDQTQADDRAQAEGKEIANSRLWFLPLSGNVNTKTQPEELPLPGLHPRWLP